MHEGVVLNRFSKLSKVIGVIPMDSEALMVTKMILVKSCEKMKK